AAVWFSKIQVPMGHKAPKWINGLATAVRTSIGNCLVINSRDSYHDNARLAKAGRALLTDKYSKTQTARCFMNYFQILKTHSVKLLSLLAVTFIASCSSQMKMKRVSLAGLAVQIPIPAAAATSTNIVVNNFGPLTDTNVLPILLTATMVSPVDIDLKWSTHIPDVDGYFVDFNFGSDRRFQILDIKYPNETTFHHPNLMPNTRFAYRIRPFFGKPSNVVSFATGDAADELSGDDGVRPGQVPAGAGGTNSMRNPLTREKSAPTDLTITRIGP